MPRRVVITGIGTVCALGIGAEALWEGLLAGRSGLGPISQFDAGGFPSRLGGEVEGFSAKEFVPKSYRKAVKVMARDIQLAVGAAKCAVDDAGLRTRIAEGEEPSYPSERLGCHIGAGLIAAETGELAPAFATAVAEDGAEAASGFSLRAWGTGEGGDGAMNNLQPLWLLKYLPNMLACHVTILHGAEGPSNTITCAEASGLLCIGESSRVIERGHADACFSGGAESKLNLMGMLRMTVAKRLAATGEATEGSDFVRPYDPEATGTLIGEAGGILILEEAQAAEDRGGRAYAEVVGFGAAHSGPPLTTSPVEALPAGGYNDGLEQAIRGALDDAGVSPDEVDAIVPQGLGISTLDMAEAGALGAVFGERLAEIPLVTLGPSVGDCAAGSGALQTAAAAFCLREQRLPARIHVGSTRGGLDAGAATSHPADLGYVLACTGSLGGQNAAVLLKKA